MSTLDTRDTSYRLDTGYSKGGVFKAALVYLFVSLCCVMCSAVIYGLVHTWYGVSGRSDYLTFAFAYPLIGGTMVCLLIGAIRRARTPGIFVTNVYSSGIVALAVGSGLRGTFEVAGKTSPYLPFFVIAGWLMVSVGAACYAAAQLKRP